MQPVRVTSVVGSLTKTALFLGATLTAQAEAKYSLGYEMKRVWFRKFSKVIPPKKAAQFFQLENQLNAALDLRVAASLPLIR